MNKNISTIEIRQKFLDFFHSKGHQIVASSSLIPKNDPTLLFTNAGMNQFKDVFLGIDKRQYSRATTSQRCIRVGGKHNDLENVGYTASHHTFFEMLGNFSFGDYFKHCAIQYAWELLTDKNWFNLSKDRLWVTVYETDEETYKIWEKEIGIPCERVIRIGDNKGMPYNSDNFWQMGDTGPCGPCTEIFYDHNNHICGGPPGSTEEKGDRYIEIWNIVFIQFNRRQDGTIEPLLMPSVDTGMGLERIAAVLQNVHVNYEIDLFRVLIESVAKLIGTTTELNNRSLRVIADHIRSCAFLIADGVIPSNESRGYVLRRIIRRAIRHGKMLGVNDTFLHRLVDPLIKVMGVTSDNLKHQQVQVEQVLKTEEEQFARTLERGLILLDEELAKLKGDILDGKIIFRLYDTYGFPMDLTADICRERNIKIDTINFEVAMKEQRRRARDSCIFNINYNNMIHIENTSAFQGYDHLELNSNVIALFVNGKSVDNISYGQESIVVLDRTPFYAKSGGQVSDNGKLQGCNFSFIVNDTQKYGQIIGHIGKLISGFIKVGDNVKALVNKSRRERISLNHSATHLMHSALRKLIGTHIIQKGSMVNDKILRFDFSHSEAMKLSEVRAIENLVNKQIRRNLPIETDIMDLETAKAKGSISFFDEKYDEYVRVLHIGDFSNELCIGTHASRTGDIGLFRIISESGIAAGIRRIEAVTGENAITNMQAQSNQLYDIAQLCKSDTYNLSNKVRKILERTNQLKKELKQLQNQMITLESAYLSNKAIEINGIKLLVSKLKNIKPKMLRDIVNDIKNQLNSAVIVLATVTEGKVFLIVGVSKNVTDRIKARELVDMITRQIDGKGGGCPEIAQAGGTNVAALPMALASVEDWITARL